VNPISTRHQGEIAAEAFVDLASLEAAAQHSKEASGSGALGKDPMDADSGFQQVTPEDSKTRVTGHSGYLVDGSKAQYQIAKVIVAKGWTL